MCEVTILRESDNNLSQFTDAQLIELYRVEQSLSDKLYQMPRLAEVIGSMVMDDTIKVNTNNTNTNTINNSIVKTEEEIVKASPRKMLWKLIDPKVYRGNDRWLYR